MTEKQRTCLTNIIHRNRTWIDTCSCNPYAKSLVRLGDTLLSSSCEVLRLKSLCRFGRYKEGHIWAIPLSNIDHACCSLSKIDHGLRQRWKTAQVTPQDVERIIFLASYNAIRLELDFY